MQETSAVNPESRARLVQLVFGHMAAQVVGTAARLGLPDLMGGREHTAPELAEECATDVGSMARLLRALAALDLLTEDRPGHFSLAPAGMLLRTDRPDSLHAFANMFTDPVMLQAWQRLESSVRTGRTAFDDLFGTDFFGYLRDNPDLSDQFNAAMSQGTQLMASILSAGYDFGRFDTVVDVGGGDGTLIAAILHEHPTVSGILFDTAEGLTQASQVLQRAQVATRCALLAGDFFTAVPAGGDLYLLKSVIHDWDDERAATILGHCRRVIPEHGRLLIVEPVLPETVDGSTSPLMYLSDLNMLVNVGGRERTRAEFDELCQRAGFTVTSITPPQLPAAFSVIEAAPASDHD